MKEWLWWVGMTLSKYLFAFEGENYCKFGIFHENSIFMNALKDMFAMLKIGHWSMIYLHQ